MDQQWHGAELAEIVNSEMKPYADRVLADGPSLVLSAKAAQNFALAIHELATNAAKYGALSTPAGRIYITWSIAQTNGSGQFYVPLAGARRAARLAALTEGLRKRSP